MIQDLRMIQDFRRIEKVFQFYSKLYYSDFSSDESDLSFFLFFAKIQNNIPRFENSLKLCNSDIRIKEFDSFVDKMPLN